MEFVFVCWDCGEDYYLVGKQVGWWADKWRLPAEAECWNCGAINETPDPPWTEAA